MVSVRILVLKSKSLEPKELELCDLYFIILGIITIFANKLFVIYKFVNL